MGQIWRVVSAPVKRRLAWSVVASLLLPWMVGEFLKTFHQAGLDDDAHRNAQFIDIMVIAVVIFALTAVFTVMLGCLITAAMKGPQHLGDPFPEVTSRHDSH